MKIISRILLLSLSALAIAPVSLAQSGPRFNGPSSCASASSLGFAVDGVTDDEPLYLSLVTQHINDSVVCVAIDCGHTMLFQSQFLSPTTAAPDYSHPTMRITGCSGDVFDPVGSSYLKFTYAGAANGGYQYINVGGGASGGKGGSLAIDNVVVTSTGTNPMFLSTMQVDVHDASFVPVNTSVIVFTVGGTNALNVARTNSINDWFSGQWNFRYNRFGSSTAIKSQSSTNTGNLVGNLFSDGGNANIVILDGIAGGGPNDSRGIWIAGNTWEVLTTGHCGIHQQHASSVFAVGNFFFDGPGGSTAFCLSSDSKNGAYAWNFVDATGIASGLTSADASNTVLSPFDNLYRVGGLAFAVLPTGNGAYGYCSDCKVTSGSDNTCVGSGTGATFNRINGVNKCFQ